MMAKSPSSSSVAIFVFISVVFCFIAGAAVGIGAYVLLPVFFAPLFPVFLMVVPVSKKYPPKMFYFFGASLLTAALLWPRYAYIRIGPLPGVTPTRIMLALSLFAGLAYVVRSPGFRRGVASALSESKAVFYSIFVFTLFRFLSVVFAKYPFESLYGFLNEVVFFPLMTLLFVAAFRSSIDIGKIVKLLVYVTCLICLLGVVEYARQQNVFAGVLPVTDEYAQEALLSKIRDSGYRVQSSFDHPLTYAQFLVCVIPILIAAAFHFKGMVFRGTAFITVVMAFGSAWLTGSRSGVVLSIVSVLSMGVLVLGIQFFQRKVRLSVVVISIFGLAIATLGVMFAIDHLLLLIAGRSTAEASSTSARLLMLMRAIPLVLDSPLVGHGVNQAATLIGFVGARGVLTVDSLLISFAVESGVIALLAYILSVLAAFNIALRNAIRDSQDDAILQLGFATSLISFLMTTVTLSLTGNMFLLALLFALVVGSTRAQVAE